MKRKQKTFTYIIPILDVVKVLKMTVSTQIYLFSQELPSALCIQRTIFKLPGSENLLKAFAYKNVSQVNLKSKCQEYLKQNVIRTNVRIFEFHFHLAAS